MYTYKLCSVRTGAEAICQSDLPAEANTYLLGRPRLGNGNLAIGETMEAGRRTAQPAQLLLTASMRDQAESDTVTNRVGKRA